MKKVGSFYFIDVRREVYPELATQEQRSKGAPARTCPRQNESLGLVFGTGGLVGQQTPDLEKGWEFLF
ncbi:MAG: hypothetical protein CMC70_08490 [Flavobacteriaceae bacterium]|nr:hypothetical protein [Flavobacteriaceae bacterium]